MRQCMIIRLSFALVGVFALLAGCGYLGGMPSRGLEASPSAPTAPTAPTATPGAGTRGIVATAALGGPQDAFLAKYGSPNDYYGGLYDVNNVTFKLGLDAGSDGQQHVYQMLAYPSNTVVWPMQRARSICTDFLPPDAALTAQGADDEGNILYHYTSVQLAGSFAASSPRYDPTGAATITYITHDGGVLQCNLDMK